MTRVDPKTLNCRECQGGLTCMHCHPQPSLEQTLRIAELEAALRPFAESHPAECVDDNGWTTTVHREPISTWLGPSDFRAARAAMKIVG